ncbi:MAG: glycerol-3-phosphate dehydrogenase C-terminal domain-containing protein, partial [Gemmatimonadaceae bacterium]
DRAQDALGRRKQRAPTDAVELPGADRSDEIAKLQRDDPALSQPLAKGLQYTAADLVYAVRNEMAQTLSDLLIRRTHLAFETRDHGKSAAPLAADVVGPLLGWSEQTKATRIREFDEDTERMFSIGN